MATGHITKYINQIFSADVPQDCACLDKNVSSSSYQHKTYVLKCGHLTIYIWGGFMQAETIEHGDNLLKTIVTPARHFNLAQSLNFMEESGASDWLDQVDKDAPLLKRPMLLHDTPLMVRVTQVADDGIEISVRAPDADDAPQDAHLQAAVDWANRRFWMDLDMTKVKDAIGQADDFGSKLVDSFWPVRPANYASAWDALLKSVVHAQIYPGLAQQLDVALAETYGIQATFQGQTYYLTPRPFDLLKAFEDELRGMKFSRQKADYLTTFPQTIIDDPTTYNFMAMRNRDGQDVVADLQKLRGVGVWTSQNVAMRGLPHADVFIDEKATRAAIAPFYYRNEDEITKKNFQKTVAKFAPYRSFACYYTYMWHFGSQRNVSDDGS